MNLSKAIRLAVRAHDGQLDKAGMPYILHPLRVMESVKSIDHKIVAVLHDIVEDTGVTLHHIHEEFGAEVADAIDAITKRDGEKYEQYLERVKSNKIAKEVKLADMADNSKPERLKHLPADTQLYLVKKYTKARIYLDL